MPISLWYRSERRAYILLSIKSRSLYTTCPWRYGGLWPDVAFWGSAARVCHVGKHVVTRFPLSDQLSFLSTALISPFSSNSSAKGSLMVLFFKLGVQKKSAFFFWNHARGSRSAGHSITVSRRSRTRRGSSVSSTYPALMLPCSWLRELCSFWSKFFLSYRLTPFEPSWLVPSSFCLPIIVKFQDS